ncbi:predicted protein [Naegleria gruberi]|uniref:Predicted protein n=1 Tax=Naegleria gruberi TaxID=5762 RepID=D2VN71_NAEGR|nr:uncharacterized protein NAEGRDRAFT_70392 [Naegleria gruberi]EFC41601.1 predicted protein [Naegleria gruberi]|eukprot:XP_002674345.1 predicted protein [Naegleria gruberi strain NEG-M]
MPFRKDFLRYTIAKVKTTFDDKWSERLFVITREEVLNTSISIGSRLIGASSSSRNLMGGGVSNSGSGNSSNNTYFVYSVEIYRLKDEAIIKMAIADYENHSNNNNNNSNNSNNNSGMLSHSNSFIGGVSNNGKLISSLSPKTKSTLHRDIKLMSAKELTNRNNTIILFFEKPIYVNFKTESDYVDWYEYVSKIIGSEESSVKEGIGAIIESITDACVVSDADGIITAFNTQAEKLFGYSKEEVIDKNVNVAVLMPESYAKYHQQILTRYNKHRNRTIIGKPRNLLAKHKLGHKMPIIINVGEVQDSNPQSKYRYIAMFRDSMWRVINYMNQGASSNDESSSTSDILPSVAMDPSFHDTHRSAEKLKLQIQKRTKTEISKFEEESLRMVEELLKMLQSVSSTINILETEKERLDMLFCELQEKSVHTEQVLKEAQSTSQIYQTYRKLLDNFLHFDKITDMAQDQLSRDCLSCWKQIQMFKKASRAFDQQQKFKNMVSHAGEITRRARTNSVSSDAKLENMFSNITKPEIISLAVQLFDKFLTNYEKGEEPISKHHSTSYTSSVISVVTPHVLPVIKGALIKWNNQLSNSGIDSTSISPELFYFVEKDILDFLKNDPIKN